MIRLLIKLPNFFIFCQCFMERFSIAVGSEQAVYCSLYFAFFYVEGVHSYDSSEFFQYLMVFDAICTKLFPPVVR